MASLNFADSLRERRDLVARHPDRNPDHERSGLKPWLSAVGAKVDAFGLSPTAPPIVHRIYAEINLEGQNPNPVGLSGKGYRFEE